MCAGAFLEAKSVKYQLVGYFYRDVTGIFEFDNLYWFLETVMDPFLNLFRFTITIKSRQSIAS